LQFLFFIDCFDRIVSQFVQLRQEYTSPAFDSLSCLVKNLVRAGGMAATSDAAISASAKRGNLPVGRGPTSA